ncbi:hypothetical protein B7R22_05315 [Subtercola boreus]|uniref:Uncharacterized protein n=1 Tax=Subtercola boreus TaxID=120213 RepID=A0A3E0W3Y6_9MICO|nr:hypothetical protein [Subtercola boreus]RFA15827.1 hypothetical protein B7R22_05315 [Subtercola boreus]
MRIERTDQGELDKIVSAPQEQGVATPLRNSSVSGGQTRFNGESSLIVNGSEDVFGTLNVQGTLNADGTVNLTTTINVTGSLTVSGPSGFTGQETHVGNESHSGIQTYTGNETHNGTAINNGATTNNGDVTNIGKTTQQGDYEGTGKFKQTGEEEHTGNEKHTGNIENNGTTTQKGDINIVAPGILRVGAGVQIEPLALGGGSINFNPGGSVFASGPNLGFVAPDVTVTFSLGNGRAVLNGGLLVSNALNLPGITTAPGGVTITPLYLGSDGRVYK